MATLTPVLESKPGQTAAKTKRPPVRRTRRRDRLWPSLAFEQRFGLGLDVAFPLANLHGMDIVLLGDLVDGFHATKRLQAKLGLELGWMKPALFCFSHW